MICENFLYDEQSSKINMLEQVEQVGKQHISGIGVDVIGEGLDMCGSSGQQYSSSRFNIDWIKNGGNVDSILTNVISIFFAPSTSSSTSSVVKNTQAKEFVSTSNSNLHVSMFKLIHYNVFVVSTGAWWY